MCYDYTGKSAPSGLIFGSHGRPRYIQMRVITRRVIRRADCTGYDEPRVLLTIPKTFDDFEVILVICFHTCQVF